MLQAPLLQSRRALQAVTYRTSPESGGREVGLPRAQALRVWALRVWAPRVWAWAAAPR